MTIGRRNNARSAPAGFTLIELVLVLLILAVLVAMAAPSLRGFLAGRQAADAALNVLSLTRWARTEAISQGHPCRLNIEGGAYWLTVQQAGAYVAPGSEMGRRFALPEGASAGFLAADGQKAPAHVQFYPSGRCDTATIELRDRDGQSLRVICDCATEGFRVDSPSGGSP